MDTVKNWLMKAKRCAIVKGYRKEADDFAQDAVIKLMAGRKATMPQLFIDYMRETYGKTTEEYGALKAGALRGYLQIDKLPQALMAYDSEEIEGLDFEAYLGDLEPMERAVIVLRYKWCMENVEIGYAFGLSHSRISQIITEVQNKLRKRIQYGILGIERGHT